MFVCVFPFCSSSSISSYILCLIFVFIFVLVFSSPLFPSFFIAVVVGTEYILHSTTTSPAAASQSFPPNWDRPHDCRSSTFRCVGAIVCKKCKERWYLNTISLPICRIWLRDICNLSFNPLDAALHGDAQAGLARQEQSQAGHRVVPSIPS